MASRYLRLVRAVRTDTLVATRRALAFPLWTLKLLCSVNYRLIFCRCLGYLYKWRAFWSLNELGIITYRLKTKWLYTLLVCTAFSALFPLGGTSCPYLNPSGSCWLRPTTCISASSYRNP